MMRMFQGLFAKRAVKAEAHPGFAVVFKKNDYHDNRGRFTSKDKAVHGNPEPLANWYTAHDDATITPEKVLAKLTPKDRAEIELAVVRAKNQKTSQERYTDKSGHYTAERRKLHEKIIHHFFNAESIRAATPAKGEKPTFIVLGGRGGSGKSAFTWGKDKEGKALAPRVDQFDSRKFIKLDSDEIKEMLKPPYKGWNAYSVHDESKMLFNKITMMAKALKLNLIHDATLSSMGPEPVIQAMKATGYRVEGHYMFVPRQVSADRAMKRYLGGGPRKRGRLVPPDVLLEMEHNEQNFDKMKHYFDKWSAYDNQGEAPVKIASDKHRA